MNRRSVAVAIVAVWLVALGWKVRREYFRPRAEILADAAFRVPPGAAYYRLDLGGQQVGFASSLVDTLADTLRVQDLMILEIPALGTVQRVEARTDAKLTRALRLRTFEATIRGADVRFGVRGEVQTRLSYRSRIAFARDRSAPLFRAAKEPSGDR